MEAILFLVPLSLALANCAASICFMRRTNSRIRILEQIVTHLQAPPPYQVPHPPPASAPSYSDSPPGYGYAYYPNNLNTAPVL